MKGRRALGAAILVIGALAACWLVSAPQQLGGDTIYSSTAGNSMAPLFHAGDLALVRPSSDYRVHEIVLYESPVLHRPVLHRIIAIDKGRYFFKGDNNDFIDPGYATRKDLLGKLWFRVPKAGRLLSFVGVPSHAGALAGLAVLVLALGGTGTARRRRRRSGRRSPVNAAIRSIHKPRHPLEELGTMALLAATILAVTVGFTTPARRSAEVRDAYRQAGAFAYSATVTSGGASVLGKRITTGQPVFLSESKVIDLTFRYRFSSRFAHTMGGKIGFSADLSSEASSWHHRYVLAKTRTFRGDTATIRTALPVSQLLQILNGLAVASGTPTDQYQAVLTPTVTVHGSVNGKPISTTFRPTLPFSLTQTLIKLDVSASGPLAGETTAPRSQAAAIADTINPSASGSIPGTGPNSVTIARTRISVVALQGLAIGLAGLLVLVLLTRPIRRHREAIGAEERAAADAGCVIVDVVSLSGGVAFSGDPVRLPDFASVVGFARYLERPILHDLENGVYTVEDGGRLYVYTPAPTPEEQPQPRPTAVAQAPRKRRGRPRVRWLGAGLLVLVAASVTATLTAANTVPLSRAGVSAFPLTPNELAPAQCAGITLTTVIEATSNATSGTPGNDLILGGTANGAYALNGLGGDDCIVAGGGAGTTNTINGGPSIAGDVCIGAPGAQNTFAGCEHTY